MQITREWDADEFFLEMLHPAWHRDALCRGMDPDIFFPTSSELVQQAVYICLACPVRVQCAESGKGETEGIWGGHYPHERRLMRRRQRALELARD